MQCWNPAVLEDANIGFGQPELTGIGKNKPVGKRNKAVFSDGRNRDLCLAKPGSISLYILYKTITRPWAQLLDSIKGKILTEKINIQSDLWHSLFFVCSAAGSSFFFITEGHPFVAVCMGRQGAAGYVKAGGEELEGISPAASNSPLSHLAQMARWRVRKNLVHQGPQKLGTITSLETCSPGKWFEFFRWGREG